MLFRSGSGGPATPSTTLAALREAIETSAGVVITYVDDAGVRSERTVEPLVVEGGRLIARDRAAEMDRAFAVHRIVGVRPHDASVG